MKIGILTYHAVYNFGANLQALANVRYLTSLGHDAKVIDYRDNDDSEYNQVPVEQRKAHEEFAERELKLTDRCSNKEQLVACCIKEKFDLILVGSDAVWTIPRSWNFKKGIPVFFMDWLFEVKELSTTAVASISAAHMGKGFKGIPEEHKFTIQKSLSKFTAIYVRDSWTKKVVQAVAPSLKQVKISADPVFSLLTPDTTKKNENEKYILISPRDERFLPSWISRLKMELNASGIKLVELPIPEKISKICTDTKISFPLDPMDWFSAIANSSGFIGIRFHAIVASITTGVPFFSVDSYGNNNYFVRILNRFKFYRAGRSFDQNSKIYQLLSGSKFEQNRVNGFRSLTAINPHKILNMFIKTDPALLLLLRDKYCESYKNAILDIVNVVSEKNKGK